ncbi:hypothetical protein Acsp03_05190 [Actinomadura sp. NBRC 104412]|uniref:PucR family transcriptional regulator n=1 Tax=Actinomadura sp. NBRC 104412 TaxID=3032203 RepID=UPI00249FA614|nr:helix-turn-helix domain-containing protein [Actinomadura sp. NBRC 104412]GLZ03052.1 hypothetical protein Acsp03_05190 [Actinomadura sp. NBRC 104412]
MPVQRHEEETSGTRPPDPGDREPRLVLGGMPGGIPPLVDRLAGDLTAITSRVPGRDAAAYVGVAGPARLTELARVFPLATRALETAVAFDLRSPVRPEDRPLELAVTHDRMIGAIAERRCLGPFGAAEERRLMLAETLSAMVETDLNVQATASRLHVHPNTVRYRVRRFEEATGLRLTRSRDTFLLWWALEHRRMRTAGTRRGPGLQ